MLESLWENTSFIHVPQHWFGAEEYLDWTKIIAFWASGLCWKSRHVSRPRSEMADWMHESTEASEKRTVILLRRSIPHPLTVFFVQIVIDYIAFRSADDERLNVKHYATFYERSAIFVILYKILKKTSLCSRICTNRKKTYTKYSAQRAYIADDSAGRRVRRVFSCHC